MKAEVVDILASLENDIMLMETGTLPFSKAVVADNIITEVVPALVEESYDTEITNPSFAR